jgi:UDP-glucose 4-epimerase
MAQSFTATEPGALAEIVSDKNRRVLVTGAAGNIGSYFAEHSHSKFDLVLLERDAGKMREKGLERFGELVEGDISELETLKAHFAGVDTVVHLAADPSPSAAWDTVLNVNITGTYNTYVAAKAAGCRRVIYASSIHAVSGYSADVQVKTSEPVNPRDLYGVSKCFGEAMGRYMAEQEGLSVIALRIGAFQPVEKAEEEGSLSMIDAFVSWRDLNQLIEKCIEVENVKFAVLHGLSNNRFKRLDISDARELVGYEPQDDATALNPLTKGLGLFETVSSHSMQDEGQKSGLRQEL